MKLMGFKNPGYFNAFIIQIFTTSNKYISFSKDLFNFQLHLPNNNFKFLKDKIRVYTGISYL